MKKWEKAYADKKFIIKTEKPSVIVEKILPHLKTRSKILDLGCGNGRNSIFLAKLGHEIEAIDIADLKFKNKIPKKIQKKISFSKASVLKKFKSNSYNLIIAARLFQYLSPKELSKLIKSISLMIDKKGFLIISYTVSGGIFKENQIKVEKFSHSLDKIKKILKNNKFEKIKIYPGKKITKHVPYARPVKTYDIIESK